MTKVYENPDYHHLWATIFHNWKIQKSGWYIIAYAMITSGRLELITSIYTEEHEKSHAI